ncbi:MAG: DUF2786 domain-containing protein [Stenotrophomonas sp.]|uniref:DUF2786 domain-containing protein n=1 Tax=Gammaproteobacteria TaxID=1236 RepID=UPI003D6C7365
MDIASALRKIQACLRMAGSSNPTEAATALRHARTLMDKYGLSETDAKTLEVCTTEAPTGYRGGMIPQSLVALANLVGDGYRCTVVISRRSQVVVRDCALRTKGTTVVLFHGLGTDSEVAGYAYAVLRRQLQLGKQAHTRRIRKKENRYRRGEEFALGFVGALRRLFPRAEMPEGRQLLLDLALKQRYGHLEFSGGTVIKSGRATERDRRAGYEAGSRAQLNQGLGEGQRKLELLNDPA